MAPMEAVMLDGGRTQPVSVDSRAVQDTRRSTRARAGRRAERRPRHGHGAALGPCDGGQEIASVQSPPLIDRLREMMNRLRQRDGRVDRP